MGDARGGAAPARERTRSGAGAAAGHGQPEPKPARHAMAPSREAVETRAAEEGRVGVLTATRRSLWLRGALPVVLLAVLLLGFLRFGPLGVFRAAFPPVEELTIQRVSFPADGRIQVDVVNGGPEAVTIRQVMVDDAYWSFDIEGGPTVPRLRSTAISIPYPWVAGEPVAVRLLTNTGVTFDAAVDVATRSPAPDMRYVTTFALLGIYVGVIPVFLGLLWLPFLRRVERRWLDFFLAFTLGLLVFLGVDALAEAVELSGAVASAFQGLGLVTLGVVATPLLIESVGHLRRRTAGPPAGGAERHDAATAAADERRDGFRIALLIALGIGLHNLGEGLAVGSAYAIGEIAVGTGLVLGFLLHNTTEGIGIVAPVARHGLRPGQLVVLGALAGGPTIVGAWIGGFTYSPAMAVLFLAVGAGAVAQVSWTLGRMLRRSSAAAGGLAAPLNGIGLVAGLAVMYLTGLLVAV